MRRRLAPLLGALAAACVPATQPPPRPAPTTPAPTTGTPPAPATDWRDTPLTPGTWTYRGDPDGSAATFGQPGAPPVFTLRCVRGERRIALERPGAAAGPMTVTTSYGPSTWPAAAVATGSAVTLAPGDPALDRIAFSRGRFSVAAAGVAMLILPAWAEPARVIEDCRG